MRRAEEALRYIMIDYYGYDDYDYDDDYYDYDDYDYRCIHNSNQLLLK